MGNFNRIWLGTNATKEIEKLNIHFEKGLDTIKKFWDKEKETFTTLEIAFKNPTENRDKLNKNGKKKNENQLTLKRPMELVKVKIFWLDQNRPAYWKPVDGIEECPLKLIDITKTRLEGYEFEQLYAWIIIRNPNNMKMSYPIRFVVKDTETLKIGDKSIKELGKLGLNERDGRFWWKKNKICTNPEFLYLTQSMMPKTSKIGWKNKIWEAEWDIDQSENILIPAENDEEEREFPIKITNEMEDLSWSWELTAKMTSTVQKIKLGIKAFTTLIGSKIRLNMDNGEWEYYRRIKKESIPTIREIKSKTNAESDIESLSESLESEGKVKNRMRMIIEGVERWGFTPGMKVSLDDVTTIPINWLDGSWKVHKDKKFSCYGMELDSYVRAVDASFFEGKEWPNFERLYLAKTAEMQISFWWLETFGTFYKWTRRNEKEDMLISCVEINGEKIEDVQYIPEIKIEKSNENWEEPKEEVMEDDEEADDFENLNLPKTNQIAIHIPIDQPGPSKQCKGASQ
jgi:hypothetical protein